MDIYMLLTSFETTSHVQLLESECDIAYHITFMASVFDQTTQVEYELSSSD